MLEGAACGPSNELLTLAAASAGHRAVPTATAKGPSTLATTEESSNPHAGPLAASGSPSGAERLALPFPATPVSFRVAVRTTNEFGLLWPK